MMTRKPKSGEALIFSELTRPKMTTLSSESSGYDIAHFEDSEGKTITSLISNHYVYNGIIYRVFSDLKLNEGGRSKIVEHFIEMFWRVE